jgi:hypothetical protein
MVRQGTRKQKAALGRLSSRWAYYDRSPTIAHDGAEHPAYGGHRGRGRQQFADQYRH